MSAKPHTKHLVISVGAAGLSILSVAFAAGSRNGTLATKVEENSKRIDDGQLKIDRMQQDIAEIKSNVAVVKHYVDVQEGRQ